MKKWALRAALFLVIGYVIWLESVAFGFQPYQCAANANQGQNACDFLSFAFLPVRIVVRFIEAHDKFFVVVGTGVIAWFTATLWRATSGLKDSTDKLWAAGEAQKTISEQIAAAGDRQVLISSALVDVTIKQKEIARQQFLAQHRPHLKVRHVSLDGIPDTSERLIFKNGDAVKGAFVVVNVGGTKAKIISSNYRIFFSRTGLPPADWDLTVGQSILPADETVEVGVSITVELNDPVDRDRTAAPIEWADGVVPNLFLLGQIRYQDEGGVDRFMGFGRAWGRGRRFQPVANPDWEYED